jgi:ribosome-binding factor A
VKAHRLARVNAALRAAIAEALAELHDAPPGIVSVIEVRCAPDLRNATAFLSIFGDAAEVASTSAALDRVWSFVAREAIRRVPLRRAPRLAWRLDESIARADRIERLLKGEA